MANPNLIKVLVVAKQQGKRVKVEDLLSKGLCCNYTIRKMEDEGQILIHKTHEGRLINCTLAGYKEFANCIQVIKGQ